MELEEMQTLWNELSAKVNQQTTLTDKLIITMTQERYKNRFSKIKTYETAGTFVAYAVAIFLLISLPKLDTWYLLACGIFSIAHLSLLPPLVLNSINKIKNISISNKNYKETLLAFAKAKQWLLLVQRMGIFLNFIFLFAILPIAVKLLNHKDIFETASMGWLWRISVMLLVIGLFSAWWYRYYKRNTHAAELLIKELEG